MGGQDLRAFLEDESGAKSGLLESYREIIGEGHRKAVSEFGDAWVSFEEFALHVLRVCCERALSLDESASRGDLHDLIRRTHFTDLYLAMAMARGVEGAWQHFTVSFGAFLISAATRQTRDRGRARSVAEEILGDLFFTDRPGGASRIASYAGTSSLKRWLWLVLQSRIVDSVRRTRREALLDSLEDLPPETLDTRLESACFETDGPEGRAMDAEGSRLVRQVLPLAFEALEQRERLVMKLHYVDRVEQKLIAGMYGVDPSRVCRWLERACRTIRKEACQALISRYGLDPADAGEVLASIPSVEWGGWLKDLLAT